MFSITESPALGDRPFNFFSRSRNVCSCETKITLFVYGHERSVHKTPYRKRKIEIHEHHQNRRWTHVLPKRVIRSSSSERALLLIIITFVENKQGKWRNQSTEYLMGDPLIRLIQVWDNHIRLLLLHSNQG